jgi:hypothetical protein
MAVGGTGHCKLSRAGPKAFLFGLFLIATVRGSDLPPSLLQDLFGALVPQVPGVRQAASSRDSAASWEVSAGCGYNDIIRMEEKNQGVPTDAAEAFSYEASVTGLCRRKSWGYGVLLTTDGASGTWEDNEDGYRLTARQDVQQVWAGLWGHTRHFSVGLSLSKALGDKLSAQGDAYGSLPHQPLSYVNGDSTLGYEVFVAGRMANLSALYCRSRHVQAAWVPELQSTSEDIHWTYPLCAAVREDRVHLAGHWDRGRFEVEGTVHTIGSTDRLQSSSPLPNEVVAVQRGVRLNAGFGADVPSLSATAAYSWGGGYMNGYSGGHDYFVLDSVFLQRASGSIDGHLPWGLRTGIYGDYFDALGPIGGINLAPFASWSAFYPRVYKIRDGRLSYLEAGAYAARLFRLGARNTLDCNLSIARLGLHGHYSYLRRELVVLIPIYTDSTYVQFVDWSGYDLAVRVEHELHLRRFSVISTLKQHLPFETGGGGGGDAGSGTSRTLRGGTMLGLRVRWRI